MTGRFVDWFNSRRWFIRYLLYAERVTPRATSPY
jgi:hypothetical protein